jgi:hypothetical protein
VTIDYAASETATDRPDRSHPACIACGALNGDGLGLRFMQGADGEVVVVLACDAKYQG